MFLMYEFYTFTGKTFTFFSLFQEYYLHIVMEEDFNNFKFLISCFERKLNY